MPRKGNKRKKTRTHLVDEDVKKDAIPRSFVVKSGEVGSSVEALTRNVRRVFEPNTATRLKETKSNHLKDFVSMAGPLGVTHMLSFSQPPAASTSAAKVSLLDQLADEAEENEAESKGRGKGQGKGEGKPAVSLLATTTLNLRIIRLPRGPTLTFKVLRYSLMSDLLRKSKHPRSMGREYATGPLLILAGFGGADKQIQLMKTVFQNLFPPINVKKMPLSSARRVVLLSYNAATHTVDFRHYLITVKHVGISRPVRKIITGTVTGARKRSRSEPDSSDSEADTAGASARLAKVKGLPDLSKAQDISDFILSREGVGYTTSDSEMSDMSDASGLSGSEDEEARDEKRGKVNLAVDYVGRGNKGKALKATTKRAVRLLELGPRMEMGLVKIEDGVCDGETLFHEYIHKTKSEQKELKKRHVEKRRLTEQRRKEQEANVKRKIAEQRRLDGIESEEESGAESGGEGDSEEAESEDEKMESDDAEGESDDE